MLCLPLSKKISKIIGDVAAVAAAVAVAKIKRAGLIIAKAKKAVVPIAQV